ncbi:MAG: hypothetical protein E6H09_20820 [Bacteroidetes bacterium]|jgi:hypothetical protein|nr:MAG: hypothetical protein E6H09_20820 [Bacteroidota bacterium]
MKLISISRIILAVCFVLVAALYSCQKENNSNADQAVTEEDAATYSDESTQAEASFDDIEDIGMQAAQEEAVTSAGGRIFPFLHLRLRLGPCAVITVSPSDSTYPKTVTIDFPGDGCWCADGKHRKGTITLFFTGPIRHSGSVVTITLTNFYLNRAHIEGTKTISNLSENGAVKFTVQVTGGKVTFPNGRGYHYEGLKYVAQIEGANTNEIADDVYKIEGRSKTQFNNGITVNLNTESPLIKKVACDWISDGTLKIKINSRVLFLDYGAPNNGDCDNQALLTWNNGNNHRLITLP